MSHKQFTLHDRERIAHFFALGRSTVWIATRINKHPSSVRRELGRNRHDDGHYYPAHAHSVGARRRRAANRRPSKIQRRPKLQSAIIQKLTGAKWTPDLIADWLKKAFPGDRLMHAGRGSIYTFVRADSAAGGRLHTHLAYGKKGYRKRGQSPEQRGKIPNRTLIDQRPTEADDRLRPGDWESDTLEGKAHKSYLATHVERTSQYLVLARLDNKKSSTFNARSAWAFRRHDRRGQALPRLTLTADNGKEFTDHPDLARRLKVDVYFANPYHPWERGLNENVNRMIRRWFPKGTDFRQISDADVYRVERLLNSRPRKSLGYRTPRQVLLKEP